MMIRYFLIFALIALFGISCSPDAIAHEPPTTVDTHATGGEHSVYPDNVRD